MKDRTELIECMARAAAMISPTWAHIGWDNITTISREAFLQEMRIILTALEQAGCVVCPKVATEEMVTEANTCLPMTLQDVWYGFISASPFRSEV